MIGPDAYHVSSKEFEKIFSTFFLQRDICREVRPRADRVIGAPKETPIVWRPTCIGVIGTLADFPTVLFIRGKFDGASRFQLQKRDQHKMIRAYRSKCKIGSSNRITHLTKSFEIKSQRNQPVPNLKIRTKIQLRYYSSKTSMDLPYALLEYHPRKCTYYQTLLCASVFGGGEED